MDNDSIDFVKNASELFTEAWGFIKVSEAYLKNNNPERANHFLTLAEKALPSVPLTLNYARFWYFTYGYIKGKLDDCDKR